MGTSSLVLHHPNREKPEAKATKAAVVLLLVTSAVLTAIVTFGGWEALQGATPGAIFYILVYAVMAYYVANWNRGVLAVAAALAVLFAVIAAVAAPAWFDRDKAGFADPALEPGILGLLTLILIPVQLLLIAFSLRGFQQEWNVEVEMARDDLPEGAQHYEDVDESERDDVGPGGHDDDSETRAAHDDYEPEAEHQPAETAGEPEYLDTTDFDEDRDDDTSSGPQSLLG